MVDVNDHLNTEALDELKEVMEDDFSLLIDTFVTDSETRLQTLSDLVMGTDADAIRREAHSLKGSSSNIGATKMTDLCKSLEDQGKDGVLDGVQGLKDAIAQEYQLVKGLLEQHYS